MKTYHGMRHADGFIRVVVTGDGSHHDLDPKPSLSIRTHSPDGFNWGYAGSGPAQLALALLMDALGSALDVEPYYQDFKREVVCQWGDVWRITDQELSDWFIARVKADLARRAN